MHHYAGRCTVAERIKMMYVCLKKVSKKWIMHYQTQSDTTVLSYWKKKRSPLSSWILGFKNRYFHWLLFKDLIIRKGPCDPLLLPYSHSQQPHSIPLLPTNCSSQRHFPEFLAACEAAGHSSLETPFPSFRDPHSPDSLPPLRLFASCRLWIFFHVQSLTCHRGSRMASHALCSSLTMLAITRPWLCIQIHAQISLWCQAQLFIQLPPGKFTKLGRLLLLPTSLLASLPSANIQELNSHDADYCFTIV